MVTSERGRRGAAPSGSLAVVVSGGSRARRHDEAVIQAEVRRLARALGPYGVLQRDALEQAAGALRWREGGFDTALAKAQDTGVVERLPAGFYRTAGWSVRESTDAGTARRRAMARAGRD